MPFIQLPGDSTGKLLETVTPALSSAGSTMHREVLTLGAHGSTDIALVTSTGGLLVAVSNQIVTSTAVTVTNPSTAMNIVGTSGAIAPATSSGGLSVTIVSGAGAGSTAVNIVGSSGAIAPATSSGGLSVTIVSGAGAGSTAVNLTGLSTAIATVTSSAGVMATISSGTITSTAATNPWSSAPGFNVPVLNASSGFVQILGVEKGTSTTLGAVVVSLDADRNALVVTLGTALTAGVDSITNVSASSGRVGTFASTTRQYNVFVFNTSSSNSITNVTTAPAIYHGFHVGNQETSQVASIKVYNSTGPTAGSTTNLIDTIPIPGGSAGAGNNFLIPQGINSTGGLSFLVTNNFAATSTGSGLTAGAVVGALYFNT